MLHTSSRPENGEREAKRMPNGDACHLRSSRKAGPMVFSVSARPTQSAETTDLINFISFGSISVEIIKRDQ